MTSNQPVILLTGQPGIGKTMVIKKIVSLLDSNTGGFYTREIRQQGKRTGFEIVTLDGLTETLATTEATVSFRNEVPFGKYRVNLAAIETVAVPALQQAMESGQVVVIDEIRPMEILSTGFYEQVMTLLESQTIVVGTIVQRSTPFGDKVKAHRRVQVLTVTTSNRARIPQQVVDEALRYT